MQMNLPELGMPIITLGILISIIMGAIIGNWIAKTIKIKTTYGQAIGSAIFGSIAIFETYYLWI